MPTIVAAARTSAQQARKAELQKLRGPDVTSRPRYLGSKVEAPASHGLLLMSLTSTSFRKIQPLKYIIKYVPVIAYLLGPSVALILSGYSPLLHFYFTLQSGHFTVYLI